MNLVDRFGRVHTSARISVTDRCNIRCFYCMPELNAVFAPRQSLLTFEEIHRLASLLVSRLGIDDIRITGGEPLVRRDLPRLVEMLSSIDGLKDLSLTTNGLLLDQQAAALKKAGLKRLNISLDTLDPDVYQRIARRDGLQQTLAGIDAAINQQFDSIKINALAIKGTTEPEVVDLVRFAIANNVVMRFIEFMPLDSDRSWDPAKVLSGDQLLKILKANFNSVTEKDRSQRSQPAEEFLVDGNPIGIIRSVTKPFCGDCNRVRVTADGSMRNCLFSQDETPLRDLLRDGASDDELISAIRKCVSEKRASHGIDSDEFSPPERPMYAIGG